MKTVISILSRHSVAIQELYFDDYQQQYYKERQSAGIYITIANLSPETGQENMALVESKVDRLMKKVDVTEEDVIKTRRKNILRENAEPKKNIIDKVKDELQNRSYDAIKSRIKSLLSKGEISRF